MQVALASFGGLFGARNILHSSRDYSRVNINNFDVI
jgi:hypothetical protein